MTDEEALKAENEARKEAKGCSIYAPGNLEPDSIAKATHSGQRSAACGDRWMKAMQVLDNRGLTPLSKQ